MLQYPNPSAACEMAKIIINIYKTLMSVPSRRWEGGVAKKQWDKNGEKGGQLSRF